MWTTHEDPMFLIEEELDWCAFQKLLPKNELEWLKVFPEAKNLVKQNLKKTRTLLIEEERAANSRKQELKNEMAQQLPTKHPEFELYISWVDQRITKIQTEIRKITWQLQSLEDNKPSKTGITEEDKEQARSVPIINFVDHKRVGSKYLVKCIFHSDTRPSLTIFPDNKFKCFSCGARGDSIDFIKQLQGIEFLDAVRWILNK